MRQNKRHRFIQYIRNTYVNKIIATILFICGYATTLLDNDATAFLLIMLIAVPLFFAKDNWILD